MIDFEGKKRVIISNIMPTVDEGKFPAKAVVDRQLIISADIFTDGHDEISALAQIRLERDNLWKDIPLKAAGNDCWSAKFTPTQQGTYQFRISGWIDSFTTWQKGLKKKYDAKQDVQVELETGLDLVTHELALLTGKNKTAVQKWLDRLRQAAGADAAVAIALEPAIAELLNKCHDKHNVTTYPTVFELTVDRDRAIYSTWYELFPRSAATTAGAYGTFNDVQRLLPRIAKMGFDVLYFPPIHPIGITHRKGRNNSLTALPGDPGSPWAIGSKEGGHKAIHPQLGNLKDFRNLVADARAHGLEIAMDIAFQCSPDHPYVKEHPEWFKWRADGTVQFAENPPKKYEDILPFNFESEDWRGLWEELRSVLEYWVENGVNIFRIDNPHTKAINFWEWAIMEIKKKHPQVLFLAEAFTRPRIMERLAKAGFTQSYTYFTWRNGKREIEEYMNELTKTNRKYYFTPNFWPNTPDILPPELTKGGDNNHIIRLLLAATLSSSYGLYGPVYEQGLTEPMPGKEEYNNNEKYEIKHWDWNKYTRIGELITRVNRIRKENSALYTTHNIEFAAADNDNIICYVKRDAVNKNYLIVVVNLDPYHTQSAIIHLPAKTGGENQGDTLTVHDLLSGDRYQWSTGQNYVQLNPYDMPGHILRVQQ